MDKSHQAEVGPELSNWVASREGSKLITKSCLLQIMKTAPVTLPQGLMSGPDTSSVLSGQEDWWCVWTWRKNFCLPNGCVCGKDSSVHRIRAPPGIHFCRIQGWVPAWAGLSLTDITQNFEYIPPLSDSQHDPWQRTLKIVVIGTAGKW